MSQYTPDLDDPFGLDELTEEDMSDITVVPSDEPIVTIIPSSMIPSAAIVATPTGDEIVPLQDFEDKTVIMNAVELAALLEDSGPHTHKTVPSFHAVKAVT